MDFREINFGLLLLKLLEEIKDMLIKETPIPSIYAHKHAQMR